MGDRHITKPIPIQDSRTQKNENIIYVWSGTGTHDPNVRLVQDHTHVKPRGHLNSTEILKSSHLLIHCFGGLSRPCTDQDEHV